MDRRTQVLRRTAMARSVLLAIDPLDAAIGALLGRHGGQSRRGRTAAASSARRA